MASGDCSRRFRGKDIRQASRTSVGEGHQHAQRGASNHGVFLS